jgi:DeoR/GlpR family transcriptional regulator of sugar metabolism
MHFLKSCAVFVLKSFAFSIIFLVCVGVNSDISNGIKTAVENTAPPSVAIDAQAEYQRQLRQSAASLQKNEPDYVPTSARSPILS